MGCDIHAYLEYSDKKRTYWFSFISDVCLSRNYALFANLAGVRGDQPDALVEPRGVPDDMGFSSESDYWLYVDDRAECPETNERIDDVSCLIRACVAQPDDDTVKMILLDALTEKYGDDGGRYTAGTRTKSEMVSKTDAARWEGYGCRRKVRRGIVTIEHPDWHSAGWLTPDEWELALKTPPVNQENELHHGGFTVQTAPTYFAFLAAMRVLEQAGYAVRVVFWFDN